MDDASLETGGSFTLTATVTNAGDGSASATTLRYHRSADATVTTTDAQVGTDAVDALAASGTSAESIALTAPATSGTYYYGACVDAVQGESDTTNNCSAAVEVEVAEPTAPDLEVGTPTVDDASPEPGGSFTLLATVTNAGDGAASATTLRYHRSADATITTTDAQVGTDAVDALAASGTSAESVRLTAPSNAGTYYYGACVDAVEGESDMTDNCSSPVGLDVVEPAAADPAADLEVGTPTVDDASPEPGGSFTLSATVTNAGDGSASATTLRYHRSADGTITTTDAQVGTDAVDELDASGSSAESIALTAPATAGIYYYGACVDAVQGESDTTNNCSAAVEVGGGGVDGSGAGPGPGGRDADGGRREPGAGGIVHADGDGDERGRRLGVGDDAALPPLGGRDDHDNGRAGGNGRGGCAGRLRDERGIDRADGACDLGHVLLRGVRGRGSGRVGHDEQLLGGGRG